MPSGAKNRSSSTSMMSRVGEGSASTSFTMSAKDSFSRPRFSLSRLNCLRHSCMIQRPMMFLSMRVVPLSPPSLVKFDFMTSGVHTGVSVSTPISDQVPLEM